MSIIHLNTEQYQNFVQQEDKPVLIEFSAPWCVYCRRLAPALAATAEEYADTIYFGDINIDEEPALAEAEQIELIPTLLLYKHGKLLGSIVAPESKAQLEDFIRKALQQQEKETSGVEHIHDMIVVGGGPGGYTAALYAARAGLDTVVLEKLSAGGQMALTEQIDNYPGFENGVEGFTLGEKMKQGAERFGVVSRMTEVQSVHLTQPIKRVETSEGTLLGKTVVFATGAGPKELGINNEQELIGKGVNYCAACDGMFYKGKTVAVVGGGNSAVADALTLSRICEKVIVVHRRDALRATKIYHDRLAQTDNVAFCWNSTVEELLYGEKLTGLRLRNVKTGEVSDLTCDGVFISVGRRPATELVKDQLALDASGYIVADESTRTNIPGVFAVGDVRTKALRQVVTAVADGAVAVHYAEEYLAGGM